MSTLALSITGPYDLTAAARFLEDWPPTAHGKGGASSLRWSTCIEGSWSPISIGVIQKENTLLCDYEGTASVEEVAGHVSRVLSVDTDGSRFEQVASRDPVAGGLIQAAPGLRPVCFWTPYEAAVWGVISQRSSMVQASRVKQGIAAEHGEPIEQGTVFPSPRRLMGLHRFPGLSPVKINRLHGIARAALDGRLDPHHLRSLDVSAAIDDLQEIEGVGPFTAELILVRGAGHPDVFSRNERRLHDAMRGAYGLENANVTQLAAVAEAWEPYRSWVSFLFRLHAARRI